MRRIYYAAIYLLCGAGATILPFGTSRADDLSDHVNAVEAGQTLLLAKSGRATLAGLAYPDVALADGWLTAHLLQKDIAATADDDDRYGRLLIEGDAQEAMLRDGAAVLFSPTKPPEEWVAADAAARTAKRGIWADANFVLTPETAAQHLQEFHVVEGTITHRYENKHATYLNFGADWHTDFSVTIPARARRSFTKLLDQINEGAHVRVRGTLYPENGPMIRLSRPEQLEVI